MKIQLKGRAIPRNEQGDPSFNGLGLSQEDYDFSYKEYATHNDVLTLFTVQEVVELVNRALYQLEYQHNAHKVRGQRQRDAEKELREMVKVMYHVSWMKATPEQIQKAKEQVEKETR